ncbi:MAG: CbiX/SirB N-terminal domain-containing protein [Dermatophilaceae bacterium]
MSERVERHGPALVVCAHGTTDPGGRAVVDDLVVAVTVAVPQVLVHAAYVDLQAPRVGAVVADLVAAGQRVVVVPALLSRGYHVEVDIAGAVAPHPGAIATEPLGPDPRLPELLDRRLADTGCLPTDPVVLAVAGSSRSRAAEQAEGVRQALANRRPGLVTLAYAAQREPSIPDAVFAARAATPERPVTVAAYLLGPGTFLRACAASGADRVSAPLAPDPALVHIVLDRYAAGCATLGDRQASRRSVLD